MGRDRAIKLSKTAMIVFSRDGCCGLVNIAVYTYMHAISDIPKERYILNAVLILRLFVLVF